MQASTHTRAFGSSMTETLPSWSNASISPRRSWIDSRKNTIGLRSAAHLPHNMEQLRPPFPRGRRICKRLTWRDLGSEGVGLDQACAGREQA